MPARQFRSKVDAWIVILLVVALIMQLVAIVLVMQQESEPLALAVLLLTTLAVFLFVGSMFKYTYYTVEGNLLRIVCGPFRWRVPIDEIHSVTPTRNPLSSPALSLDRLRIIYGNDRKIMISPADRAGFLDAIGHPGS